MSTEPTPAPSTNRNKPLLIVGIAIVVLLAIIAWAVVSQTVQANQKAAAEASAAASASAMAKAVDDAQKVIDDQIAADAKDANTVCEKRLMQKHPTATVEAGKTNSTYKPSDNSYDTVGAYTDDPAGNPMPMQFACSSLKHSDGNWGVFLKNDGHGSLIP